GGRDPVDTKRYLAVLKDLFDSGKMPEHGGEILGGDADGIPQAEIAEETGLTERQVKQRLKQMRERFARRLDELGLRDGVNPRGDKS
ncbi:MAG TPA: winged helix-turn-helix transcriptional regulator, partial [Polyangiaceae bacterium]|nr:winged helix-turn-helix transcriptional regulator [Polyangiaceae bacterium]